MILDLTETRDIKKLRNLSYNKIEKMILENQIINLNNNKTVFYINDIPLLNLLVKYGLDVNSPPSKYNEKDRYYERNIQNYKHLNLTYLNPSQTKDFNKIKFLFENNYDFIGNGNKNILIKSMSNSLFFDFYLNNLNFEEDYLSEALIHSIKIKNIPSFEKLYNHKSVSFHNKNKDEVINHALASCDDTIMDTIMNAGFNFLQKKQENYYITNFNFFMAKQNHALNEKIVKFQQSINMIVEHKMKVRSLLSSQEIVNGFSKKIQKNKKEIEHNNEIISRVHNNYGVTDKAIQIYFIERLKNNLYKSMNNNNITSSLNHKKRL